MTDGVWEYIFGLAEKVQSDIPKATLGGMRREFSYWYPVDVRVSGKDLVNNHLIFFLYIHQAIWGPQASRYLPRGIRLNRHLMLNCDKMSKSTGNFLALTSAIEKFGADATRIALADGGDGIDDANFKESTANAVILRLFELKKWIEAVILNAHLLRPGEGFGQVRAMERPENTDSIQRTEPMIFWDALFMNDVNMLIRQTIQAHQLTNYKAALKSGFYDFTAARDAYRAATHSASIGMHHDCIRYYVETQALMVCIFAPHWADYIWREPSTIQLQPFPDVPEPNIELQVTSYYAKVTSARILAAHSGQQKRLAKGKGLLFDPSKDERLNICVAKSWLTWQERHIDLVRELFDGVTLDGKAVAKRVEKAEMKKAMSFIQELKRKLESGESRESVLDRALAFDEVGVLKEMAPVLESTVPRLKDVNAIVID
ncbi:Leucine--tRNA ligase, cytoplasmic [Madurella mycetomatis]|uniref:Leucine--tRNA ligase, cytoplasmic n=1 Tax=Madurella mycetomatis TaxID=100816 RepID=A0A175VSW4_9PEZI|nr:Leucine--tRNA ligase, cytoplasmic [Madurella mycetomatis]